MTTMRLFPPEGGATLTVNGRVYTCAAGATILVSDFDAVVLLANRWSRAGNTAGPTLDRPKEASVGEDYYDDDLGLTIYCTGHGLSAAPIWRRADTGAVC